MNQGPEVFKLGQLRAKTERQLIQIIGRRLDEGLHSARESGDARLAMEVRAEAATLLPLVRTASERQALETKLAGLEEELDARADNRALAAC